MNAGRKLDALMAEKVMGWKRVRWCDWQLDDRTTLTYAWHDLNGDMRQELAEDSDDYYSPTPAWSPSTSIADAWQVVEKMLLSKEAHVELSIEPDGVNCTYSSYDQDGSALARTAPLAICLASLKAVGVEVAS